MGKRKGNLKKSQSQVQAYNNFIANSSVSYEGTLPVKNNMLQGSAELSAQRNELDSEDKIKKTPVYYRFLDWIKANIFPVVITTIIVAVGTAVITHAIKIAVIEQRIEYIETQINSLQEDVVTKESLSLQLEEVKTSIDSKYSLTINDIEWQLKLLEEKLESIGE